MLEDLEEFFSKTFFQRLSELTGLDKKDLKYKEVKEICSTIYWMK